MKTLGIVNHLVKPASVVKDIGATVGFSALYHLALPFDEPYIAISMGAGTVAGYAVAKADNIERSLARIVRSAALMYAPTVYQLTSQSSEGWEIVINSMGYIMGGGVSFAAMQLFGRSGGGDWDGFDDPEPVDPSPDVDLYELLDIPRHPTREKELVD